MSYMIGNRENGVGRVGTLWHAALLLLVASTVSSCGNAPQKTATEGTAQKVFVTPADAGAAFVEAAKSGDQAALLAIFGPDGRTALFSGDAVKDKDNLQDFVAAYNQMHRWREIKVGGEVLYVGADNYPFPIPLGKNAAGQWVFDTAAGKDEILARRIGRDELTAIAASSAVAEAQAKYFRMQKQYAQKFISDEGKQGWIVLAGCGWPDAKSTGGCSRFRQSRGLQQRRRETAAVRWLLLPHTHQTGGQGKVGRRTTS